MTYVESASSTLEDKVTVLISLPGLDDGDLAADGLLHHVGLAVEHAHLLGLGLNLNLLGLAGILDGETTLLNDGTSSGRSEESRDTSTTSTKLLCESALRGQLELQLTLEVLTLELSILTDIRSNDLLDALIVKKDTETPSISTTVVGNNGEILDTKIVNCVDSAHGNTTETETTSEESITILELRGHNGIHRSRKYLVRSETSEDSEGLHLLCNVGAVNGGNTEHLEKQMGFSRFKIEALLARFSTVQTLRRKSP